MVKLEDFENAIEFSCGECGKSFDTARELQKHVDDEHEILFVLTDRDQYETVLPSENGIHPCGKDTSELDSKSPRLCSTQKSVRVSIQANPVPYCSKCNKSFSNNHGFQIHNGRYHKDLAVRNDHHIDDDKSSVENIVEAGVLNSKVFCCNECDKLFKNNRGLLIHNGRYHKTTGDDGQDDDNESGDEESAESEDEEINLFFCDECGKSFNSFHGLLIHNGRYHKRKILDTMSNNGDCGSKDQNCNLDNEEDGKLFSCSDCDKFFDTFHGFLIHAGRYHKEPIEANRHKGKRKSLHESDTTTVEDDSPKEANQLQNKKKASRRGHERMLEGARDGRKSYLKKSTINVLEDSMVHSCNECDKSFNSFHGLLIHQGRNHKKATSKTDEQQRNPKSIAENGTVFQENGSSPFFCDDCNISFDSIHGFQIHAGTYHKKPIATTDVEESKGFVSNAASKVEPTVNDTAVFFCDDCDKSFNSYHGLLIHNGRSHRDSVARTDQQLGDGRTVDENLAKLTENEIPELTDQTEDKIKCSPPTGNHDLQPFSPLESFHHSEVKPFKCETCGKAFSSHSNRKNHINAVHKNLRLHACSECNKAYKFRRALRYHFDIAHKNLPPRVRRRPIDGKPVMRPKPFHCDTCGQRFACLSHRREHIDAVHKKLRQYPCPICGRRFLYSYDVPKHINIIHKKIKPYKCDTCGMAFTYFTQRKSHIDIVHKKLKQYICPECKDSFNCRSELCKHLKETHLGPYPCPECGRVYKFRRSLNLHIDTVHKRLRLHKCEICGKTYPDKATLNKHTRFVHKGVKNYKCEYCGKAFPTASVHRLHVDVIHKGLKPFKCQFCRKAFATRAKCRRHANTMHQCAKPPSINEVDNPSSPSPRSPEQMDTDTIEELNPSPCNICEDCFDGVTVLKDQVSSVNAEQ